MRKYFYFVKLSYEQDNGLIVSYELGLFSSLKNAKKKIDLVKDKNGFKEFSIDKYKINKHLVKFDEDIKDFSNIKLYLISHKYEDGTNDCPYYEKICYTSSLKKAKKIINKLKNKNKIYQTYFEGFEIDTIKDVDCFDRWNEGFEKTEFPY